MSGFMPNADGIGEDKPVGKVVILEDSKGDGKMDKRTVFLDGLVMARSFMLVRDGILLAEPPKLWFVRNENGKAGPKMEVAGDYAREADPKLGRKMNPEHAANSLTWTLDNWIYSAAYTTRFRTMDSDWQRQPTAFRGQYGLSQDDYGRLVYNSNSDQLRIDLVPSAYLVRNPFYRGAKGLNVNPCKDQATWPIRVNPGVNRGYRRDQLREDGTLATYTAACGPVVYRGENFPKDCYGNAFLCEPAGNFVRRNVLIEKNGTVTATNAYYHAEFLASTDEWFRPVNLNTGPDGALYVVDLHHGILQHRVFLTSYLRKQAESRGLDKAPNLGRIFRVVYERGPLGKRPQLSKATPVELVQTLSHPNGWWRDTAQRLLVESSPGAAIPALKTLATDGKNKLGRLHALWTLDGMGLLDIETVKTALTGEQDPKVRAAAIRLSEPFLKIESSEKAILPLLLNQAAFKNVDVQLQLAFTLGQVSDPRAAVAMGAIHREFPTNEYIRDAIVTGLGGREEAFIERLAADQQWKLRQAGNEQLLGALARCVFVQKKSEPVNRLLDVIAASTTPQWQQDALINGITGTAPASGRRQGQAPVRIKLVRLPAEPKAMSILSASTDKTLKEGIARIDKMVAWPGKPGVEPEPPVTPLTVEETSRFALGKTLFETSCAACHQAHGYGMEGLAPPLVDSEWVAGTDHRLARIVLHGLHGPVFVKGQRFDLDMPAFGSFDDGQLAAILTYVRREWEHTYDPVSPATLAKIRTETNGRLEAWTEAELLKVK
jgi:mono/diheme cytochrome c family protein